MRDPGSEGHRTMSTAIVTGITGQDGSYLAEFLLRNGYRLTGNGAAIIGLSLVGKNNCRFSSTIPALGRCFFA